MGIFVQTVGIFKACTPRIRLGVVIFCGKYGNFGGKRGFRMRSRVLLGSLTALGSGDTQSFGVEERCWVWGRSQLWGLEALTALGLGSTHGFRVAHCFGVGDCSQIWGH